MQEGESAWAQLKEWVTWLHDRYELSVETRLPRCWPQHPGLVEELWSLKAWREEIYGADIPAGQAARYWHAELRGFITSGIGFYARNCRTGHKSDGVISATSDELRTAWLEAGSASYTSVTLRDNIKYDGSWWHVDPAAPGGWTRVTDTRYAKLIDARAAAMAGPDAYIRRKRALHGPGALTTPAAGTARAGD